jgi:hypothetical protein
MPAAAIDIRSFFDSFTSRAAIFLVSDLAGTIWMRAFLAARHFFLPEFRLRLERSRFVHTRE